MAAGAAVEPHLILLHGRLFPLRFDFSFSPSVFCAAKVLIDHPGLSGFIDVNGQIEPYTSALLGMIDIFFILQLIYLIVGTGQIGGVKVQKSILTVLISLFITMTLSTLPGFVSYTISGMNITRPFFL